MQGKSESCEKYLRLLDRKFQRQGEELWNEGSEKMSEGVERKQETEMVEGTSFTSRFDVDKCV